MAGDKNELGVSSLPAQWPSNHTIRHSWPHSKAGPSSTKTLATIVIRDLTKALSNSYISSTDFIYKKAHTSISSKLKEEQKPRFNFTATKSL